MSPANATKNEHSPSSRRWWLVAALLVVAGLRLWRLPEAGAPDYDSVRNWQAVLALTQGDFSRLFVPGCPAFLLSYALVALFTRSFLVFQTINALVGVAGLGFFATWVARKARLSGPEAAGLVLLGGTGLLLTFAGRDFTPNSVSLLLCAGLFRSHLARLARPGLAALVRVAVWLALGLSFSYKFLFALPILLVLEVLQADGLWRTPRVWARVLAVLAAPYVLFGTVGVAAGLPWYRWLAFYVRTVAPTTANAAGRQATLKIDFTYYLRYLAEFESPLLLAGLALAAWLVWREWRRGWRPQDRPWLLPYLLFWALCLLAGMSLLLKAPRGLLFAYLPLAALAVLAGRRVLPRWALLAVLAAAVCLNVFRIEQTIYASLPTPYAQVAAWLQQHGARKVASTVGLGLAPYLNDKVQLTVINDEKALSRLRQEGYDYVLLDGYWRVAGVARFDSLRRQVPVAAWPAPQLQQPLLFLEHSEYTGRGFAETLAAGRAAAADSLPLRLYRLR
ncbi:Rossmann-fold NAD(P)-binding domain-containing protein [Hymenobacter properus]|uniref:Uncharacterized protein n=1 Tax=Hymenobacter properus TaxID=2791026 RepID=A0A931BIH0_9BACT|nr:hypothetical protein [Hymenobacter properus]MBF9142151.1 hypothetical protein [Hymenobacter properus]MBR7720958.1 hypothetical protein [Microvirga sp. SRT04]